MLQDAHDQIYVLRFGNATGHGYSVVNYVNAQDFDGNEFTFENIGSFCEFVFNDEHEGYMFIAHNAKSLDAQFILKYCIDNAIKPFCIYNGTKIMYMAVKNSIYGSLIV